MLYGSEGLAIYRERWVDDVVEFVEENDACIQLERIQVQAETRPATDLYIIVFLSIQRTGLTMLPLHWRSLYV